MQRIRKATITVNGKQFQNVYGSSTAKVMREVSDVVSCLRRYFIVGNGDIIVSAVITVR